MKILKMFGFGLILISAIPLIIVESIVDLISPELVDEYVEKLDNIFGE